MFPTYLRCEYLVDPLGLDVKQPRLSWVLEDSNPQIRGQKQTAYQILVASKPELLTEDAADLWNSQKIGSDASIQIEYSGEPLQSFMWCFWKARVWDENDKPSEWAPKETSAKWSTGYMNSQDIKAQWISQGPVPPEWAEVIDATRVKPVKIIKSAPSPLLRKSFQVQKPITHAVAIIAALGDYEAYLNGKRIGENLLTPEWTNYKKRVLYQTYDVSSLITTGTNAIGAILADGWYMGNLGPGDGVRQRFYGDERKIYFHLKIEYTDGTTADVLSDGSWKYSSESPILSADNFMGEEYDSRKEIADWMHTHFDDSSWKSVIVDNASTVILDAQKHPPIRIFERIKPREISEPKPGVFICDMGQNLVGWCQITVSGQVGDKIILRHGEMLNLDGTLYTENLRLAQQTDTFILNGKSMQVLHPHFTFHGFRYVEITGLRNKPDASFIESHAFCSSMPVVGAFECSDPLVNQLWSNILWTQRNNMVSVPTDCPQRNERMGWMGDAQVFAQNACFNMDMAGFFTKWTQDIRDAQREDGRYPDFAPHPRENPESFTDSPAWADAGIIIPWTVYLNYHDKRILEQHYESAKRFVDNITTRNPNHLWTHYRNNYGDWLNGDTLKVKGYPKKGGQIPKPAFATLFYAISTQILAKMARILNKSAESDSYFQLYQQIVAAFLKKYTKKNGTIVGKTQAGYALALNLDIFPDLIRPQLLKNLLKALKRYKNRMSTGFISTIRLMLELSRWGYNDLAYHFVQTREFPSWGYSIAQGATTIWERWDGYVAGRGFQSKGMNSFDHYAIGAVGEWMYRVMLGINWDEEQPAMKHFYLRPQPGGTIQWVKGAYTSPYGKIAVDWKRSNMNLELNVQIPLNTTATLQLANQANLRIIESGKECPQKSEIDLLSGRYQFVIQNYFRN